MREEVYDIRGMHCAACAIGVERAVKRLAGVETGEVNLLLERLTIRYDEELCSPKLIMAKVEKAGFSASPHQEEAPAAQPELGQEKRELIVSLVLAAGVLILSMGQMLLPSLAWPEFLAMHSHPLTFALIQLGLTLPVLYLGRRFFINGLGALFRTNPNMDTLVGLSAGASLLYSLVMTLLIPEQAHRVHDLYYESAAVVVALVSVGKYLEARSQAKTKSAIMGLMALTPDTALLVQGEEIQEVLTRQARVGDTLLVRPGGRVPLDGVVIEGRGSVNEAMLTGESLPVEKEPGSQVIGGSVNVDGALYIRVSRIGQDTTLAKIIKFVENAQAGKAPISRTADRVAGVFVPIVIAIALCAAIIWLAVGQPFSFALRIFTAVLVIACPCAMGLATPTAIIVGTGLGASRGILIRSGAALEMAHQVRVAVLDKTGTLTLGQPAVTELAAADEKDLLAAAIALESLSDHPLAQAIRREAEARGLGVPEQITDFRNISGRGLLGYDGQGQLLLAGNQALLEENGADAGEYEAKLEQLQKQGHTVALIARAGRCLGLIALADPIKEEAAAAVAALKSLGVLPVLLTGDNRAAARRVAGLAGIEEVRAQVLPEEKAAVVQSYQAQGKKVMMVGDGINDAPALAQADVGCAIGGGSDIAIDSADIVLMSDDLLDLGRALRLSRLTIRNIRQNLFWAFCYNVLGIPIAAGALYPAFGLLLSPMIGGLAMSLSSLFVVTNALRLKGKKLG